MTKHLAPGALQAFFDQAINNKQRVSSSDRMFMQLILQPPAASLAPGIEKIGQVRTRTFGYVRYPKKRHHPYAQNNRSEKD